jgi:hypothetical protein
LLGFWLERFYPPLFALLGSTLSQCFVLLSPEQYLLIYLWDQHQLLRYFVLFEPRELEPN